MYINFEKGNFITVCSNYTAPTLDRYNGSPCITIPECDFTPDFRSVVYDSIIGVYGIDARDANVIEYKLAKTGENATEHYVLYATIPGSNKTVAFTVSMLPGETEWLVDRFAVAPVLTAEIRAEIEREAAKNNPVALAKYLRKRFTAWTVAANPDLAKLFRLNNWMDNHVNAVLKLWQEKIGFELPEE